MLIDALKLENEIKRKFKAITQKSD